MDMKRMVRSASGREPVDILMTHAQIINVFSGEIISENIAVANGYIVGFGNYDAKKTVDIGGRYLAPGFIDAHVHIESAMTSVQQFARAVVPFGTTLVVADPHEIANVLGVEGIRYMLSSSKDLPMNVYFTLPSCVPATDMETSGAVLAAEDILPFVNHHRILGLAEMMNYPGVIHGNPEVLKKIEIVKKRRKSIDGHAPGIRGRDLWAYVAAGISSDHECTTPAEAVEKLNAGMHIMIREGTGAKNLKDLLPVVNSKTARRIMWCTDDRHPHDLLEEGHIDSMVRRAIQWGLDPITAIRMATINAAEYFGLHHLGAVGPGRQADLILFSDMNDLYIEQVYHKGVLVAEDGKISPEIGPSETMPLPASMNVKTDGLDLSIPVETDHIRVIDIVPDQIITRQRMLDVSVSKGRAISDITRDILKIAVVERHTGLGGIGKGFVRGFGLKQGALASSVAHDSHNIIVVGTNDDDMKKAVQTVAVMGGGMAVICGNRVCSMLALPIAGLMSFEPVHVVRNQMNDLIKNAQQLGSSLHDPFMTLSFLALPVIPELKITDKGLVDVRQFKIVPLFVNPSAY